jgi:hypothetical protein
MPETAKIVALQARAPQAPGLAWTSLIYIAPAASKADPGELVRVDFTSGPARASTMVD